MITKNSAEQIIAEAQASGVLVRIEAFLRRAAHRGELGCVLRYPQDIPVLDAAARLLVRNTLEAAGWTVTIDNVAKTVTITA
jgi:hypothetical protein